MLVNSTIEEIIKAEWPSVERQLSPPPSKPFDPRSSPLMPVDFIGWNHRLTPGFPSLWPCPPDGEVIYYAWAAGLQPNVLRDAVRTTVPWARFTVSLSNGNVQYQRLEERPEMAAAQAFWPLTPAESAFDAQSRVLFEEFPTVLSRQVSSPDHTWLEHSRRSYRFWIKCNGVIARQIRPSHDLFFAWVESEP